MRTWLWVLSALLATVCMYSCVERLMAGRSPGNAEIEFHRITGGLGMGDSRAIYWDFASFDPRLEPDCTCSLWPVPGGFLFSPEHRQTVWDPPELNRGGARAPMRALETSGE